VSDAAAISGGLWLVLIVVSFVVLALWVLLPFAVFGIKTTLKELLREQRHTNHLLEQARRSPHTPKDDQDWSSVSRN
jgi:biopolymer transport protein ExbB/TolQ